MAKRDMNRGRMRSAANWAVAALLACGSTASAQVIAPPIQLPQVQLPTGELQRTVDGVLQTADVQALKEVRKLRIRALLRDNRAALEADPRGAVIIRNEVAALSPTAEALALARSAGFSVSRTRMLEGLGVTIVVLQAPPGVSTRRALQRLRDADPSGVYDFNHVYTEGGEIATSSAHPQGPTTNSSIAAGAKVGLIDGGVQRTHVVFRDVKIHEHGCAGSTVPSAHGTAVASLIAGNTAEFHGAAPGAQLYAADVYCGLPTGGAIDALADAFAWLSREGVPVINVSLVGPPNSLLQQIIRVVTSRGHIIVAAVGNDGPGAPPLYPAAYPEVIAVTGVDARNRALFEACRGKHVDFAAPGANMSAAGVEPSFGLVRGTSFAAPIVAGLLARELESIDKSRAEAAVAALIAQAADLGARGRDKVYGDGLLGEAFRPSEQLTGLPAAKPRGQ
jgi:subtilisin family serine protease